MAKPEYPVIDKNPPFTKAVANFSFLDYLRMTTITSASVPFGYLAGGNCSLRGPSMVTAGIIGLMGGLCLLIRVLPADLWGYFPTKRMLPDIRRGESPFD